jgi:hypothetical protein
MPSSINWKDDWVKGEDREDGRTGVREDRSTGGQEYGRTGVQEGKWYGRGRASRIMMVGG